MARPDSPPAFAPGALGLTRRRFLVVGAGAAATLIGASCGVIATPVPSAPTAAASPPPPSPDPPGTPSATASPAPTPRPSLPSLVSAPNRVALENQLAGDGAWLLPFNNRGDVEGYFSQASASAGDQLQLYARATGSRPCRKMDVALYRLGWYGGAGGRMVQRWKGVALESQPDPVMDPTTGLTRAPWSPALTLTVPAEWTSGLYLAVMRPQDGEPRYATFVVREPAPAAPILVLSAATNHQAYNHWGGKSLYTIRSNGAPTCAGDPRAVMVSFDRPYRDFRGAGLELRWENNFVRWVEAQRYNIAYAADSDLQRDPSITRGRRLIVFAGHPEYVSPAMRATLDEAVAAGTNLAFFSGNELYWRVRLEDGPTGPGRTVVCYRDPRIDPMVGVDSSRVTNQWREEPNARPESLLIGQMYGHVVEASADFVCSAPSHWIYVGTGMRAGDSIPKLVGQEYDRYFPEPHLHPPGTEILAVSPVQPHFESVPSASEPWPAVANATIYTAPSGATVFSAGTMQWSWGLDGWNNPGWRGEPTPVDPRAQRITANVLDRLGS